MTSGSNKGLVSLDIHNQCIGRKVRCDFRKSVGTTLVVDSGHDDFASEFPNGTGNEFVVRRDEDAFDRFGALNAPVDVLY
jgi:hypothetical protein